jgi:hypothetical protein
MFADKKHVITRAFETSGKVNICLEIVGAEFTLV